MQNGLTVEDTFLIAGRGLIVAGELTDAEHGFKIGARVTIVRPDGSRLGGKVRGTDVSGPRFDERRSLAVLLEGVMEKGDVPHGSFVTVDGGGE